MFRCIRKTLIQIRTDSRATYVRFLETLPSPNSFSKSNSVGRKALAVSYLINSCGLSPENAISASKVIAIHSNQKPDSVLGLLRSHGFTQSHISALISKHPSLLLADPERNLKPKFEFVESLGISGPDLCGALCSDARILRFSLNNHIIPTCDFLKGFLGACDDNPVKFFRLLSDVLHCNIQKVLVPNISTLRETGVPQHHIVKLLKSRPKAFTSRVDFFQEVVNEVKEMGLEPNSNSFCLTVACLSVLSKTKKEKKKELLVSYGWSEKQLNAAVKVQPMLMACSEKKIRILMDFFLDKVGLMASDVARCPGIFLNSLEKRITPRWLFLKVLLSKGLVKKDIDIVWALNINNKLFEKQYVNRYEGAAPEVIKAYRDGMGFQGSMTV